MEQCGLIGSIFSPNASEQEQAFRTTGAYVKLCKHRINRQVRVSPGKLIGTQQSGHLMIINTFFTYRFLLNHTLLEISYTAGWISKKFR